MQVSLKFRVGSSYIPRGQRRGRGVHEMTMNDHVVTWTETYFASDQKKIAWILNLNSYKTNFWIWKSVSIFLKFLRMLVGGRGSDGCPGLTTCFLLGVGQMTMFDHDGGRGAKISEKSDHVVYGCPLNSNKPENPFQTMTSQLIRNVCILSI